MNAKVSALLLTGLLLLMIVAAWAQTSDAPRPTCPPLEDPILQDLLQPSAWVKANWNMNTSRWDIDCTQMDAIANMPGHYPSNSMRNAAVNATNSLPPRRGGSRGNSNYRNSTPYVSPPDTNVYTGNATITNVAANAVKPARPIKREPNTRRP